MDSIPYFRIFEGRIFIGTVSDIDFDPIMQFCSQFIISTAEKNEEDIHLRTGRQRWKFHANEKGVQL